MFQFKTWDKHSVRGELTEWSQGLGTGFGGRKEVFENQTILK